MDQCLLGLSSQRPEKWTRSGLGHKVPQQTGRAERGQQLQPRGWQGLCPGAWGHLPSGQCLGALAFWGFVRPAEGASRGAAGREATGVAVPKGLGPPPQACIRPPAQAHRPGASPCPTPTRGPLMALRCPALAWRPRPGSLLPSLHLL